MFFDMRTINVYKYPKSIVITFDDFNTKIFRNGETGVFYWGEDYSTKIPKKIKPAFIDPIYETKYYVLQPDQTEYQQKDTCIRHKYHVYSQDYNDTLKCDTFIIEESLYKSKKIWSVFLPRGYVINLKSFDPTINPFENKC